jgi:hypothetical protein
LPPKQEPLPFAPDEEPVFFQNEFEPVLPGKPDLRGRHFIARRGNLHIFIVDDHTVAFAPSGGRADDSFVALCVQLLRRPQKGPLDGALAEAAKKRTVVAGLNLEALAKSLPEKLPAEAELFRPFFGARSALVSLDLGDELKATFAVDAGDADPKKIEDGINSLLSAAKGAMPNWKKEARKLSTSELALLLLAQGEKALEKAAVERQGGMVRVATAVKPDGAFEAALKAAMAQVQVARERSISQNNLHQLSLAVMNFESAMGRFPFPGIGKNGAPLGKGNNNPNLSWRVAILPYIEQAQLYNQFKLDESWDSEHNKALIPKMPKIFAPVNGVTAEKGHTFYQIFTGREAMQPGMLFPGSFPDGTSNTLMIVESGDAVPWTRPEDMLYDSKKPLPKLGGLFGGDFHAAFCDGSVRYIRKSIPEKALRALITPAGGEAIDWDWDK